MLSPFESMIAKRYLWPGKGEAFIALVAGNIGWRRDAKSFAMLVCRHERDERISRRIAGQDCRA